MSAHTPGPWELDTFGLFVTAEQQQMRVCDLRGFGYLTGRGTRALSDAEAFAIQEANGRLIAAAPDLLEAILDYLGWGAMTGSDRDLFESRFRAVVAKAEGCS